MTAVIARPISGSATLAPKATKSGGSNHREADVGVGARVVAVRDQRRAAQPSPSPRTKHRGDPIAGESHRTGKRQRQQVIGCARVQQAVNGHKAGYAGADQNRGDDEEAGEALGPFGAQQKGDTERNRGQRVAEVVDQIGEQRDAAGGDEDQHLNGGGQAEDAEGEDDRAQTVSRALDAGVD